jgi:hypothetical protein
MPFSNAVFQCCFPMPFSNAVFQWCFPMPQWPQKKVCWTELENEVENGKCVAKWHQQIEYKTGVKK